MKSEITHVFFDAAGTLLQLREPVGATYAAFGAEYGLNLDARRLERAFLANWTEMPSPYESDRFKSERDWWHELVRRVVIGGPKSEEPAIFDAYFDAVWEYFSGKRAWAPHEEVLEVLETLKPHFELGIISNFDARLRNVLKELKLKKYFKTVTLSENAKAWKPDPAIFEYALEKANAKPETSLHAGDDPKLDWSGARKAGMKHYKVQRPDKDLRGLLKRLKV